MTKAIFAAAALCLPTPILADITAAEVWEEMQNNLFDATDAQDFEILLDVGAETVEDDGLLLSDVRVTHESVDETVTVDFDWIRFENTAADVVEITFNPITNIHVQEMHQYEDTTGVTIDVIQSGFVSRITGDIENYTIDSTAKYVKIALPIPESGADETGIVSVLIKGITSQSEVSSQVSNLFSDLTAAIDSVSIKMDMEGTRPTYDFEADEFETGEQPEVFAFTSEIRDIRLVAQEEETGLDHEISSFEELPEMRFLASIADADLQFSYNGFSFTGDPVSADIVASTGEMRSELSISQENISAEAVAQTIAVTADLDTEDVTDIFDGSLDEAAYRMNVDLDLENGRAEGSYRENIDNLLLSSSFWDLFDPEITIPRDPISSVMDVAGELLFEPANLDVEDLESANTDVFKTLRLKLNQYLLSGAGVRIEASGEAIVDMDGIDLDYDEPKMSASMHLDLQGGFDLIGKLLELEIIPADIAFGARTVIGMVGVREGDGDHFVSDISIDENGDLTVNGKPFDMPN